MKNFEKNDSSTHPTEALYRFRLMQGNVTQEGRFERGNSVGIALLRDGHNLYTLKLNTFPDSRFYLAPSKDKPSRYLLMTRELAKNPNLKRKYYWSVIGNGSVDASVGVIRIKFDLFEEPIYMSLFPEAESQSAKPNEPEFIPEVFDAAA